MNNVVTNLRSSKVSSEPSAEELKKAEIEVQRVCNVAKLYRGEKKIKTFFNKYIKNKNSYKTTLLDILEKQKKDDEYCELLRKQEDERFTEQEDLIYRMELKEMYERYAQIGNSGGILKKLRTSCGYNELIHLEPFDAILDYHKII